MHILLVNDDGIFAPGIRALCAAAVAAGHRVSVCAPDRERSAASHSATFLTAIHARETAFEGAARAWAADGTPADCAHLGLYLTREDPVDMVVSGINRGMNLGGACVYSGTVAAAMEASMSGVPGLAVSLCTSRRDDGDDYAPAARLAMRVADWARTHPLPRGAMYNLNVPVGPYEAIRGLVPARLAPVFLDDALYVEGVDEEGPCYSVVGGAFPPLDDPDSDLARIEAGYATLTKLTWDLRLDADDSDLAAIGL